MLIRKQRVLQLVFVGLAVFIVSIVWMVYSTASFALTSERALHANLFMVSVLRDYVIDTGGGWPRSWSDLERVPARQPSMYRWPADADKVRQHVWVDFNTDLDKLAAQSRDEFDAVKPVGPCFAFKHHSQVDALLDTIRQLRAKKLEGTTRPASTSPDR